MPPDEPTIKLMVIGLGEFVTASLLPEWTWLFFSPTDCGFRHCCIWGWCKPTSCSGTFGCQSWLTSGNTCDSFQPTRSWLRGACRATTFLVRHAATGPEASMRPGHAVSGGAGKWNPRLYASLPLSLQFLGPITVTSSRITSPSKYLSSRALCNLKCAPRQNFSSNERKRSKYRQRDAWVAVLARVSAHVTQSRGSSPNSWGFCAAGQCFAQRALRGRRQAQGSLPQPRRGLLVIQEKEGFHLWLSDTWRTSCRAERTLGIFY